MFAREWSLLGNAHESDLQPVEDAEAEIETVFRLVAEMHGDLC